MDDNSVALVQRTAGATVYDVVSAGTSSAGLSRLRRSAGDTLGTEWTEYLVGGAVATTQPSPAFALHDPIAMDVDGDGTDEVVVGSDDGWLYAVHASDGSFAFSLDLGAPVQRVVAADIDLDPALELEVSLADGRLVAIDGPGKYTAVRDVAAPDGGAEAGSQDGGEGGASPSCPSYVPTASAAHHAGCSASATAASSTDAGIGVAGLLAGLAAVVARRRRARA